MARLSLTADQVDYLLEQMRVVEIGAKNTVDYTEARMRDNARFDTASAYARAIKQHSLAKEVIAKLNGAKLSKVDRT